MRRKQPAPQPLQRPSPQERTSCKLTWDQEREAFSQNKSPFPKHHQTSLAISPLGGGLASVQALHAEG